jgi:N-acetylneuraminic acid mutarotase
LDARGDSARASAGLIVIVMRMLRSLSFTVLIAALVTRCVALDWQQMPAIPDREGFAGSFAGVAGGALVVAGGANFPERRPWEGGAKRWYDRVFVLEAGASEWREAGRLPDASAYGASVQLDEGLLMIGGGDAMEVHRAVRLLRYDPQLRFESWPDLPFPLVMCAAARVGRMVYVAGGLDRVDAATAQRAFLALNLDDRAAGWKQIEPWPGPERILATAGAVRGAFCIMGGARVSKGPDGKPVREWLRDGYVFSPGRGWRRLADLPRGAVGAPSPAPVVDGKLWLLGGDDGSQAQVAPADHRGFCRDILALDLASNAWTKVGEMPFALVTTPAAVWQGRVIVPGGERQPGIRSTAVWAGK